MRSLVQRGAAGVLLTWCLLGGSVGALRLARLALVPVLVLSGAQIIRSTILFRGRVRPPLIPDRPHDERRGVLVELVESGIRVVGISRVAGDRPSIDFAGGELDQPLSLLRTNVDDPDRLQEVGINNFDWSDASAE